MNLRATRVWVTAQVAVELNLLLYLDELNVPNKHLESFVQRFVPLS